MSNPSEDIFDSLKDSEKYAKRYMDRFGLDSTPANPLLNVVPNKVDDFFPTKVCQFVCLTAPCINFDSDSIDETMTRLKEVYKDYDTYQVHIMIDMDADDVKNASTTDVDKTDEKLKQLISDNDGESYGLKYWGKLSSAPLRAKVTELIDAFFGIQGS